MSVAEIIQGGLIAYIVYMVIQLVSYLVGLTVLGLLILFAWSMIVGC